MEAVMYGTTPATVQECLPQLVRMLEKKGDLRALPPSILSLLNRFGVLQLNGELGPNAAFVSKSLYQQWHNQVQAILPGYREALAQNLPRIEQWLANYCPDISMGQRWTVLAGWLLDLGLARVLREVGWQESEPSRFWIWFFEAPDPELIRFGVRVQADSETQTNFGELWVEDVRKIPPLPLNLRSQDIRVLWTLQSGGASRPPVADLMRARYFGLVRRQSTGDEVVIPCFNPQSLESLDNAVTKTARGILARTLLQSDFAPVIPNGDEARRAIYLHAFSRLFMQSGLRELLNTGVLVLPDSPLPASWGTWLARGNQARKNFELPFSKHFND
ncbi:hypothetical protein [Peribacillus frigoritolerans]|uniref:hypothetical protein n=1 Tax=Peribacillus frigoritolerans TaxID=450367 RepID=UPI001F4FA35B|nr:hypothetical protein [Peribacillus frigoritolerans]MCK2020672.1 hypothetical protein [Peribacillus frigoritolerans]